MTLMQPCVFLHVSLSNHGISPHCAHNCASGLSNISYRMFVTASKLKPIRFALLYHLEYLNSGEMDSVGLERWVINQPANRQLGKFLCLCIALCPSSEAALAATFRTALFQSCTRPIV